MKKDGKNQSKEAPALQTYLPEEIPGIHARAEHWLTDLDFHMDEIRFLQKLVSNNFVHLFDKASAGRLKVITDGLESLQSRGQDINTLIRQLLGDLKDLAIDPFAHDLQPVKVKVGELETRQANFLKTFRELKREIFSVSEKAIESGEIRTSL